MNLRVAILSILLIAIISCKPKVQHEEPCGIPTISPLINQEVITDLSDYIDEVKYSRLNFGDTGVYGIKKMLLLKNGSIIVSSAMGIFLFDQNLNLVHKYGFKGNGPNEYTTIHGFCLSLDQKTLTLLIQNNQLLEYNVSDGELQKSISLEWEGNNPETRDICPASDNGFFVYCPNPFDITNPNQEFYCLSEFDSMGTMRAQSLKWNDYVIPLVGCFTQNYNNDYLIRPIEGLDIANQVINGKITQRFSFDFGDQRVPVRYLFSLGDDPIGNISEFMRSSYFKVIFNLHETKSHLFFICAGVDAITEYFFISKESQKVINWSNFPNNLVSILNSSDEYFYMFLEETKSSFLLGDNPDPLVKYLIEQLPEELDPEQYPVLVKFKLAKF